MESDVRLDWEKIGLKAGLEIHQQLKTQHKLFCGCPIEGKGDRVVEFQRRLRPTRSELGEVDIAAYFEWKKGMTYKYRSPRTNTCLVEADEEPPHEINREAVLIGLGVAKALNSTPVDEIHVMRKIVIDGSNTSGFQRTALIAIGGEIEVEGKVYGIQTICVEEDASRKEGAKGKSIEYNLDRLGIPLIEISTTPDIRTPEEAEKLAYTIGQMLRLTGRVRRGIGTIRQDLNVSITGGEKIEIKGVQELGMLSKTVKYEALRQYNLLALREEMVKRGLGEQDFDVEPVDVTRIFHQTRSNVVKRNLAKKNSRALAVKLRRMRGLLGRELQPGRRFGTELADYARFWGDVKGLFHSDELPGYGITQDEVQEVFSAVKGDPGEDAFVLIVDEHEKAEKALEAVLERVRMALHGVPRETRMALPDGTTRFMRPQPGAARMYPETDIPPLIVTQQLLIEAEKLKPPHPERKIEDYIKMGLSPDLAKQVIRSERLNLIERLFNKYGGKIEPKFIASTLIIRLKGLKREGVRIENINEDKLERLFELISENKVPREAIDKMLELLAENPEADPLELAEKNNLLAISMEDLERIIMQTIKDNCDRIQERGEKSLGFLMGRVMEKVRGRAQGKTVSELLKRKLKEAIDRKTCVNKS